MQTLATAFFSLEESTFIELLLRAEIKNDRAELRFDNPKKMNDALACLEKYGPEVRVQHAEVSAISFSAADWTRMTAEFLGAQGNNTLATPAANIKPVDKLKAAHVRITTALQEPTIDWKKDDFFSDKLKKWSLPTNIIVLPWQPIAEMLNTCYPDAEGKHRFHFPKLCNTAGDFAELPKNQPLQCLINNREGKLFLVCDSNAHRQLFQQVLSAFPENVATLFRLGMQDLSQGLCFGKDPTTRNALLPLLMLCRQIGLRELEAFQAEFIKLQQLIDAPGNPISTAAFAAQATACIKTFLGRPMLNKSPPHAVLTQIYGNWGQALQQQAAQTAAPETQMALSLMALMSATGLPINMSSGLDSRHTLHNTQHNSSKVIHITNDAYNQTPAVNPVTVTDPSRTPQGNMRPTPPLIHPSAEIDPTARIDRTAIIGKNVKIEKNVQVGAGSIIDNGAQLHTDSIIGERTKIGAGTSIGTGARIGNNLSVPKNIHIVPRAQIIQLALGNSVKIPPQSIVKGNLTIASNVKFAGPVEFGKGVQIYTGLEFQGHIKLENFATFRTFPAISDIPAETWMLCNGDLQMGKNVKIGKDVELGAGVKIGNHVTLGDGVQIGAGAAINDYCCLAAGVTVGADATVSISVPEAGAKVTKQYTNTFSSLKTGSPISGANPSALKRIAPSNNAHEITTTNNSQSPAKRPRIQNVNTGLNVSSGNAGQPQFNVYPIQSVQFIAPTILPPVLLNRAQTNINPPGPNHSQVNHAASIAPASVMSGSHLAVSPVWNTQVPSPLIGTLPLITSRQAIRATGLVPARPPLSEPPVPLTPAPQEMESDDPDYEQPYSPPRTQTLRKPGQ